VPTLGKEKEREAKNVDSIPTFNLLPKLPGLRRKRGGEKNVEKENPNSA